MKIHELKVHFDFMPSLLEGRKNFELRRDDRNYEVGDELWLRGIAYDDWGGRGNPVFLGPSSECRRKIVYILRNAEMYGLQAGFCILGLTGELM